MIKNFNFKSKFQIDICLDPGMNGYLSDTQDSRSSNDSGDLGPDDDNSLDSDKALNLVFI